MPLRKQYHRIARDLHRLPLLRLVGGFGIVQVIDGSQEAGDLRLEVEHPPLVDLSIQSGMARGALLHKFCKHSRLVGQSPRLGHVCEDPLPLGLARPKGNDGGAVGFYIFFRDGIALQLPGVEHIQILHAVAGQFGKGRHALGPRAPLAHNQLPFAQVDRFSGAVVVEICRPQHRHRQLPEVLPVKLRFVQRPFDRERWLRLHAKLPQLLDPFVHSRTYLLGLGFVEIPFAGCTTLGNRIMDDYFFEHGSGFTG